MQVTKELIDKFERVLGKPVWGHEPWVYVLHQSSYIVIECLRLTVEARGYGFTEDHIGDEYHVRFYNADGEYVVVGSFQIRLTAWLAAADKLCDYMDNLDEQEKTKPGELRDLQYSITEYHDVTVLFIDGDQFDSAKDKLYARRR